ncbi:hypothetical protein BT69DRAFT_756432 [Atractiella rhizophila]|nr:hypothetical protein BT69DRAFT_756432 [Atractiella rhizophila]
MCSSCLKRGLVCHPSNVVVPIQVSLPPPLLPSHLQPTMSALRDLVPDLPIDPTIANQTQSFYTNARSELQPRIPTSNHQHHPHCPSRMRMEYHIYIRDSLYSRPLRWQLGERHLDDLIPLRRRVMSLLPVGIVNTGA